MMGEACGELRGGIVMYWCLCEGLKERGAKGEERGEVEKVVVLDRMLWRCVIHLPSYQMHPTQSTRTYLR